MKWLIESDVFDDTEPKLIETLKSLGIGYHLLKYIPFDDELAMRVKKEFPEDEAIFYGSLNFASKLHGLYKPGIFGIPAQYNCNFYYPLFGDNIINKDYHMIQFGELKKSENWIYEKFGHGSDKIFIRPNSGLKQFTGTVVHRDKFDEALKFCGFYEDVVTPDLVVVISSVKDIIEEYRFVVINNEICTGSLYGEGKRLLLTNEHEGWKYASDMAKLYKTNPVWVLDIAKTKDAFFVLEIGCFNYAGLYGCDIPKIVQSLEKSNF